MSQRLKTGVYWVIASLLAVTAVVVLVWTLSRFWPLTDKERQALSWMRDTPPIEGGNGYALLWMLELDGMDDAARERALAADARAWEQSASAVSDMTPSAAAHYPRVVLPSGTRCGDRGQGCLAAVRADPIAYARSHIGHEGLHERIADLGGYDHFSGPWQADATPIIPPLPALQATFDPLSAHALAYLQGDVQGALHGLCSSILAGRRLLSGSDLLAGSMVGAALVEVNGVVLADVLSELPVETALPVACEQAMQPLLAEDMSLCRAMRGEWAMSRRAVRWTGRDATLLFDPDRSEARMAAGNGWACDPAQQRRLAEDEALAPPSPPPAQDRFVCLANAIGCSLVDTAVPHYRDYARRSQDVAAMIRLLAAQRWLRQQSSDPESALPRLPAKLRSSTRVPVVSADGTWLQLQRHARPVAPGQALLRVRLRPDAPLPAAPVDASAHPVGSTTVHSP